MTTFAQKMEIENFISYCMGRWERGYPRRRKRAFKGVHPTSVRQPERKKGSNPEVLAVCAPPLENGRGQSIIYFTLCITCIEVTSKASPEPWRRSTHHLKDGARREAGEKSHPAAGTKSCGDS